MQESERKLLEQNFSHRWTNVGGIGKSEDLAKRELGGNALDMKIHRQGQDSLVKLKPQYI